MPDAGLNKQDSIWRTGTLQTDVDSSSSTFTCLIVARLDTMHCNGSVVSLVEHVMFETRQSVTLHTWSGTIGEGLASWILSSKQIWLSSPSRQVVRQFWTVGLDDKRLLASGWTSKLLTRTERQANEKSERNMTSRTAIEMINRKRSCPSAWVLKLPLHDGKQISIPSCTSTRFYRLLERKTILRLSKPPGPAPWGFHCGYASRPNRAPRSTLVESFFDTNLEPRRCQIDQAPVGIKRKSRMLYERFQSCQLHMFSYTVWWTHRITSSVPLKVWPVFKIDVSAEWHAYDTEDHF